MARFVNEVLFMSILWVVKVHEAVSQATQNSPASHPEIPLDASGAAEHQLSNDAIEMGRTAAEDMGNLMASPPVSLFHLNGGQPQPLNARLLSEYQLPTTLHFPQTTYPFLRNNGDSDYCAPRPSVSRSAEWSGRSSSGRTNPMTLPLVPLPLSLPLSQPLFILDALIPRPAPPQRLLRPLLAPKVPLVPVPALSLPSALIRQSPLPLIPRAPLPLIPPAPLPLIPKLRSSFTPYSYFQKQKPLVLYAR